MLWARYETGEVMPQEACASDLLPQHLDETIEINDDQGTVLRGKLTDLAFYKGYGDNDGVEKVRVRLQIGVYSIDIPGAMPVRIF